MKILDEINLIEMNEFWKEPTKKVCKAFYKILQNIDQQGL